ncbi:MAG: LysR family transcriptional regulator [Acidimicrobiales bacterium]
MDLRQLAALVAVAEQGSFSAAARALHTVQSNVSTHVARLERELGTVLIDRATGTLTDEGEVVIARARRVRHELDSLQADVASMLHTISGRVRLGCMGTVGRWLVPRLFRLVRDRHPDVQVVIVDATTTSLLPQLVAETLDMAIVNLPINDPELATESLFDEDRVVIAPTHHALATHRCIDLAELARHELLLEPQGTPFRDELDDQAADAGVTLRTRAEVDGIRLLTMLAFEGFGPAVVPTTAAPPWVDTACCRIAVEGLAPRSVGLARAHRGRLSAPARAIREAIHRLVETADVAGIHPTIST